MPHTAVTATETMTRTCLRIVTLAFATAIVAAMAISLWLHGGPMWRASMHLEPWGVATAFLLCIAYRFVNAMGWGFVLGSLGERVRIAPAARIWLAAEACRWIPGSMWALGSRAFLASARGIPLRVASASVVLEMVATVVGWAAVAMLGAGSFPLPGNLRPTVRMEWAMALSSTETCGVAILAMVILASIIHSRPCFAQRLWSRLASLHESLRILPDGRAWAGVVLFFTAMAVFNGVILVVVVRAHPGAREIPVATVITANAIAWLAGFLAIVAPGGLVVREACLAGLLSVWISPEHAIVVSLAWRLLQVVTEIVSLGAVVAVGLPTGSLLRSPPDCATGRVTGDRADGIPRQCGMETPPLGVA